jgi:DNA-directed RNA polymerase I, II, and III subunit RPABC2
MPPKLESADNESSKVNEPIKKKIIIKKKVTIAEPEKGHKQDETVIKVEDDHQETLDTVNKPTKLKITKKKIITEELTPKSGAETSKSNIDRDAGGKDKSKHLDNNQDTSQTNGKEVLLDISKSIKSTKKISKKQDNQDIFNEDDVDFRFIMMNYDFSKNKTLPKITKYEKSLLVGKRAKQIEEGANPNVKVLPGQNTIEIAEEELRQRKIPFIIKRPVGNKFEYWRPADMEIIMD